MIGRGVRATVVVVAVGAFLGTVPAAGADAPPCGSRIGRPVHRGTAYVTAVGSCGQGAGGVGAGYALGLLARPLRASEFVNAAYAGNTGLLLQVDVQEGGDDGRMVSGDVALRRYLGDVREDGGASAWFAGLGAGLTRVEGPGGGTGFAALAEIGREHALKAGLVLLVEGQYRLYRVGDWQGSWSLQAGLALRAPL